MQKIFYLCRFALIAKIASATIDPLGGLCATDGGDRDATH